MTHDFPHTITGSFARPLLVYSIVVIVVTSAVWGVKYHAPQDGSAHVYNAFLMSELVKGNPHIAANVSLNTLAVPNSTGHWFMALILQVFSPFTCLKLMTAGTYALFVASIVWFRYSTVGANGLTTSVLLGAAVGLNWLWFGGLYNFIIGVIGFLILVSLFFRWRARINGVRVAVVALILVVIYLSHAVSFSIAAGSLFVLAMSTEGDERRKTLVYLLASILPSIALALCYRAATVSADQLQPVWRWLSESTSALGMLRDLFVDPFIIMSRRALPFTEVRSTYFVLFSPGFWTAVSIVLLGMSVVMRRGLRELAGKSIRPFAFLFGIAIASTLLAPDDFGLSNGGVLRERILLCGLCFFVPLFDADSYPIRKRLAQACLIYVVAFQAIALWDYAYRADQSVDEFSTAQSAITDVDSIASIEIIEDGSRFHSIPEPHLGLVTSVGKNTFVLDNYEIGHYLFPVITKDLADRQFVRELAASHMFFLNGPESAFDQTLERLDRILATDHQRFTKIILWGNNDRVESILAKWFDQRPVFENGRVKVLRHRD